MQNIDTYNFNGKRAIIRVDFNTPLDQEFNITDDTRIRAGIPTLKKILSSGASLVIMSHLGKPLEKNIKYSLIHIKSRIEELLGQSIDFCDDCLKADEQVAALKSGEVLLLENVRFYPEEDCVPRIPKDASDEQRAQAKSELKISQQAFVDKLASYADCYVNDAFGTAHRAHGSTALIASRFPNDKMFGYVMQNEVEAIDKIKASPKRPLTAIVGGAKVSSKIGIIEYLLDFVDNMIVAGGMCFTFEKALGGNVGNSLCEDDQIDVALRTLEKAKKKGVRISFCKDVVAADRFANDANTQIFPANDIPDGWMGMDAGPETLSEWEEILRASKTVLWNGPAGVFEMPTFAEGTMKVASILAQITSEGVYTLVGGGDSVAAVKQLGYADKVSYVSTGGGAMLESLKGIELPGITAIREN